MADPKKKLAESNLIQIVIAIKRTKKYTKKDGMQIVPEIYFSCKRPRRLCVASSYLLAK